MKKNANEKRTKGCRLGGDEDWGGEVIKERRGKKVVVMRLHRGGGGRFTSVRVKDR